MIAREGDEVWYISDPSLLAFIPSTYDDTLSSTNSEDTRIPNYLHKWNKSEILFVCLL